MSEAAMWFVIGALIIMFYGDPDLHDKLLEHYSCNDSEVIAVE